MGKRWQVLHCETGASRDPKRGYQERAAAITTSFGETGITGVSCGSRPILLEDISVNSKKRKRWNFWTHYNPSPSSIVDSVSMLQSTTVVTIFCCYSDWQQRAGGAEDRWRKSAQWDRIDGHREVDNGLRNNHERRGRWKNHRKNHGKSARTLGRLGYQKTSKKKYLTCFF